VRLKTPAPQVTEQLLRLVHALHAELTGQHWLVSQLRVADWVAPGVRLLQSGTPPALGAWHVRLKVAVPVPQVTVQLPACAHCDQPPLTGQLGGTGTQSLVSERVLLGLGQSWAPPHCATLHVWVRVRTAAPHVALQLDHEAHALQVPSPAGVGPQASEAVSTSLGAPQVLTPVGHEEARQERERVRVPVAQGEEHADQSPQPDHWVSDWQHCVLQSRLSLALALRAAPSQSTVPVGQVDGVHVRVRAWVPPPHEALQVL